MALGQEKRCAPLVWSSHSKVCVASHLLVCVACGSASRRGNDPFAADMDRQADGWPVVAGVRLVLSGRLVMAGDEGGVGDAGGRCGWHPGV